MAKESSSGLYLFLSVDITGSTDYKNKNSHRNKSDFKQGWYNVFSLFYTEFPNKFKERLKTEKLLIAGEPPNILKTLGDEIIFYWKVPTFKECKSVVYGFYKTLIEYKKQLETDDTKNLSLKGTAWLVGIPIINAKIPILKKTDFIGPSVDTGFRLSKFSSSTEFFVSVELAYLLAKDLNADKSEKCKELDNFYYIGDEILKGVYGNTPYPKIFIRIENPKKATEYDKKSFELLHKKKDEIVELTDEYIDKIGNNLLITRPYINIEDAPERHRALIPKMKTNPEPLFLNVEDPKAVKKKIKPQLSSHDLLSLALDELSKPKKKKK